jgi:putative ABC transport system permease protein
VANLHRPYNQTTTVVVAIGFGAFLLGTLFLTQYNLLRTLRLNGGPERPNLVLFDIQPDQRAAVDRELAAGGYRSLGPVPIVPMRIQALKGRSVTALGSDPAEPGSRADASGDDASREGAGREGAGREDASREDASRQGASGDGTGRGRAGADRGGPGPGNWAVRREYRSTYRDTLVASERIVAGRWWSRGAKPVEISMERDVAGELGLTVGDEVVWDVQGVPLATRIASLRQVDWARFEPNFFVVFAPGALESAPQSLVTLTRVPDPATRGALQRRIAERLPNVTTLDLSSLQATLERLVDRVVLAIRFMALFTLAAGTLVLVGALATSRFQRVREGALLRTLGATRAQLLRIVLSEYLALGGMAAAVALALSGLAGWALTRFVFDGGFAIPAGPFAALGAAVVALTVGVGLANSRDVLRRPPLEVLRAE